MEKPKSSNMKILIVDDDKRLCGLVADYLEPMGYAVKIAHNGPEGLKMILEGDFHAVILDVMMPQMSGFEVCRRLRNSPETKDLPVIMVTALNELGDIERAIQSASLGLNPSNDGNVIRVPIPELTEDRRRDMSKMAREYGEQGKVAVRKSRQQANDAIKKSDDFTEDDAKSAKEEIQKLTDRFCVDIDKLVKDKEAEIMEI